MDTQRKKMISELLIKAMEHEELNTRATAKLLNINPCYVSMARSEKSWEHMGSTPWMRLEEWYLTREPLKEFKIPPEEALLSIHTDAYVAPKKDRKKEQVPDYTVTEGPVAKIIIPRSSKKKPEHKNELDLVERFENMTSKLLVSIQKYVETAVPAIINQHMPKATVELTEPEAIHQRMSLDIEINLILNGQKIRIS
jgi:hypothetical protein